MKATEIAKMSLEFDIAGQHYKSGQLDAFKQSHIVRRLAPVFGAIAPAFKLFQTDVMAAFEKLAGAIAKLSDEDVEYIQRACLAVVQRQQGANMPWVQVMPTGGRLAFDDIGLLELNEICFYVLKDNLAPFFSGIAQRGWAVPL